MNAKDHAWLQQLYEEGVKAKPPPDQDNDPPPLFPDLLWIWQCYCFLSERRGIGANGPLPITVSEMLSYSQLTGRIEQKYKDQMIRFIPPLDREFLRDHYDKQAEEAAKTKKAAQTPRK